MDNTTMVWLRRQIQYLEKIENPKWHHFQDLAHFKVILEALTNKQD